MPSKEIPLETQDGTFYFFKADILKGMITYSTDKSFLANGVTISARRAFEIIGLNKRGEKPDSLTNSNGSADPERPIDLVEQESLTRFDKRKSNNNRKKKKKPSGNREANKEMAENNKGNNTPNEQEPALFENKGQEKGRKSNTPNKKEGRPQREREDKNRNRNRNNRSNGNPNNRQGENKETNKEKQLPPPPANE